MFDVLGLDGHPRCWPIAVRRRARVRRSGDRGLKYAGLGFRSPSDSNISRGSALAARPAHAPRRSATVPSQALVAPRRLAGHQRTPPPKRYLPVNTRDHEIVTEVGNAPSGRDSEHLKAHHPVERKRLVWREPRSATLHHARCLIHERPSVVSRQSVNRLTSRPSASCGSATLLHQGSFSDASSAPPNTRFASTSASPIPVSRQRWAKVTNRWKTTRCRNAVA